ncbi:unnamed protein product [marine sediment metagenome]|uniref:Uncharacterized protein n=1 Tax=marine sediment metagenome TaxID=412755 RepID=X1AV28_9ZZZZ
MFLLDKNFMAISSGRNFKKIYPCPGEKLIKLVQLTKLDELNF